MDFSNGSMNGVMRGTSDGWLTPKPKTAKKTKAPSIATMEKWMNTGVAKATDGCRVEPDGTCIHGKPSWLLRLGMI